MKYTSHQAEAKQLMKKVADRIINDTTYCFKNKKNGEVSKDPSIWEIGDMSLESGFNDWKYWNGVIHLAMHQVALLLKDETYHQYVNNNYSFAFRNLDLFQKQFEMEIPGANFHQFFRCDRLDDFGAMAAGMMEPPLKMGAVQDRYLERVADYIQQTQDRLDDGTFCRRRFGVTTLWADDLYMSIPFLVRMYVRTDDESWLEDAILQSENFHQRLFDSTNGLYHHCWYDNEQYGVAHWSRANGWVMMARINLMDHLPKRHPYRQSLVKTILDQIVGLSRYQSENGCWHQLLDKQDSFIESSGTSMFCYGIARSVNQGWIPEYYSSIALEAWNGLKNFITEDGLLEGVSLGFNIRQDLPFYYRQPFEEGGAHGLGAFLLAASEMARLKSFRDCVWC
jgi:rhamnogalacturonyl hydrolase YesR